jgi:hypothetical protein
MRMPMMITLLDHNCFGAGLRCQSGHRSRYNCKRGEPKKQFSHFTSPVVERETNAASIEAFRFLGALRVLELFYLSRMSSILSTAFAGRRNHLALSYL